MKTESTFLVHPIYLAVLDNDINLLRDELTKAGISSHILIMCVNQAIQCNQIEMLQMIYYYDKAMFKDIHYAETAIIKGSKVETLDFLLGCIANINNHIDELVVTACLLDRVDILVYFNDKGFNVTKGEFLKCAASSAAIKIIEWLLPNVDLKEYGLSALQGACSKGDLPTVKLLHLAGVDILDDSDFSLITASKDYIEVHKYLIANGVRLDGLSELQLGYNYEILLDYQTSVIERKLLSDFKIETVNQVIQKL